MKKRTISSTLPESSYFPFSVNSIIIKQRNHSPETILKIFSLQSSANKNTPQKFRSPNSNSITTSKQDLSQTCYSISSPPNPRKKHFLTSPFGVILKGKKLKQPFTIGNMFRDSLENKSRNSVIRSKQNMRDKFK